MTDNEKIARWLGWELETHPYWKDGTGEEQFYRKPRGDITLARNHNWSGSNAAAIELLPVLVEKGYHYELDSFERPTLLISKMEGGHIYLLAEGQAATISEAITAVICQLIEKEENPQ